VHPAGFFCFFPKVLWKIPNFRIPEYGGKSVRNKLSGKFSSSKNKTDAINYRDRRFIL